MPAAACCPDDGELARFLDRSLASSRTRTREAHFERCADCRALVYVLAEG